MRSTNNSSISKMIETLSGFDFHFIHEITTVIEILYFFRIGIVDFKIMITINLLLQF